MAGFKTHGTMQASMYRLRGLNLSTLSLNRGIVDGGNSSFCQCSKILVAEPVQDVGVVFTLQYNMFANGSKDPCNQVFICLPDLSISKSSKLIV